MSTPSEPQTKSSIQLLNLINDWLLESCGHTNPCRYHSFWLVDVEYFMGRPCTAAFRLCGQDIETHFQMGWYCVIFDDKIKIRQGLTCGGQTIHASDPLLFEKLAAHLDIWERYYGSPK